MKAVYYEKLGPAAEVLKLEDLPIPTPEAGEVRIKVLWSGVNPSDCKSRSGLRIKNIPYPRVIPHSDGMGIIDAVGRGLDPALIGKRVWVWNAARGRAHGTACEYLCLPKEQTVDLPANVTDETGACLGVPALTAMHAILMGEGVLGKKVFIAGGAGAVGNYAIQMATQLGAAQVITSVSSVEKAAIAKAAGADHVILYKEKSVVEQIAEITQGSGVDKVIELDIAANGCMDIEILRPGGECIVYGSSATSFELPFYPLISKNLQLKFFIVYDLTSEDRARAISVLTDLLSRGSLTHHIADHFSIDKVIQAHELVESGKAIGKVLIKLSE